MSALPILVASPEWTLLAIPRLVVTVWRTRVTVPAITATERAIEAVVRASSDQRYGAVSVVEREVSMSFEDRARDASASVMRRWGAHSVGHGYLVEGTGFLPAAVRTATAGLALITRAPFPSRVFDDALALAEWLAPLVSVSRAEVSRAIVEARSAEHTSSVTLRAD